MSSTVLPLPDTKEMLPRDVEVIYIKFASDGGFQIVNESDAELLKIVYPDGRVEFATLAEAETEVENE